MYTITNASKLQFLVNAETFKGAVHPKKLLSSEFKVETFSFKVENFEEYSTLDPIDFCCTY